MDKKIILGALTIIVALSFIIISMPGVGVKMRIDEDKTTFYIKHLVVILFSIGINLQ